MIISLIGFMGTGKSSVGELLAEKLNFHFYETDKEIEKKASMSISEIFDKYGEKYFRQLEKDVLERAVLSKENIVLSTGGGIVLSAYNRRILKEKTTPILLTATVEEIFKRVKDDSHRPLLTVKQPLEEIKLLLEKRNKYYKEFNFKIATDDLDLEEIIDIIMKKTGVGAKNLEEVRKDDRKK